VRVTADGHCKLLDFGALTSFGPSELTVGTPPAIAPEVTRGAPLDWRIDPCALGKRTRHFDAASYDFQPRPQASAEPQEAATAAE
jgi:serine/threonine protein kinase